MKSYFGKLFRYDSWANSVLLSYIESHNIKDEQIQKLLSHILNAEYIWLFRVSGKGDSGKKVWDIHSFGVLTEMSDEISVLFKDYILSLSDQDFNRVIKYTNSQGQSFSNTVEDIFAHVINHGTYHRAQINQLIRKKNLEPPVIDFIVFVRS